MFQICNLNQKVQGKKTNIMFLNFLKNVMIMNIKIQNIFLYYCGFNIYGT